MSPRKTSEASRSEAQKTKQPHLESDEDSRPTLRPALWATSPNSVVGERLIADPGVKPPWLGAEKLGVVLGVFKGLTRKRCLEEVFPENRCFCGLEEMFFKEEHRTCYVVFSKRVGYIIFECWFPFFPTDILHFVTSLDSQAGLRGHLLCAEEFREAFSRPGSLGWWGFQRLNYRFLVVLEGFSSWFLW